MPGLLVIISGPSGVGKNTVIKKLQEIDPEMYVFSISATTRKPRGEEKDGQEYFFLSKEEFLAEIDNEMFLEWAQYNENYYGTPKKYVSDKISESKVILAEIEVQGAMQIMKTHLDKYSIFLLPPDKETLFSRLRNRGTDAEESIMNRLAIAEWEMEQSIHFDENVVNDDLDATVSKIHDLILKKLNR